MTYFSSLIKSVNPISYIWNENSHTTNINITLSYLTLSKIDNSAKTKQKL